MFFVIAHGALEDDKRFVNIASHVSLHRVPQDSCYLIHTQHDILRKAREIETDIRALLDMSDAKAEEYTVVHDEEAYFSISIIRHQRGDRGPLVFQTITPLNDTIFSLKKDDVVRIHGAHPTRTEAKHFADNGRSETVELFLKGASKLGFPEGLRLDAFHAGVRRELKARTKTPT